MEDLYNLLDYSELLMKKKELREKLLDNPGLIEKRVAILCGSTFGEIKEFIELFLLCYGIKPIFLEGNYNRYYEEACFPNAELSDFKPDFILLHMTNKNLIYNDSMDQSNEQLLKEEQERLSHIWRSVEEKYHCCIIQNNFEYFPYRIIGNGARTNDNGNVKYIDDLNRFVSDYAEKHQYFLINDIHYLSSYVGLLNWYDDRMWRLYKCPMAMSVMPRYALSIANIIKSVFGKNKKAIITDLDNTLWGGIIGEAGINGIKLGKETPQGEGYSELHKYLKKLSQQGVLLNVCSKNEYETGISGLRSSKSILKEEDFIVREINWNNKPDNVRKILCKLNILADSVLFLDDSQIECESVKEMVSGMETLQVSDIDKLFDQMEAVSYFETAGASMEDKKRHQLYKNELERSEEKRKYETYEEYLKSLEMVCRISDVNEKNMQRTVQLFNKTNQFNFTTNRYTMEEMYEICKQEEKEAFVLSLEDRFGDNGIVSAMIVIYENGEAHIRDWIMSCRVFERGIEYEMLKYVCRRCIAKEMNTLYGYYHETEKNKKIEDFYEKLNFIRDFQEGRWICKDIDRLCTLMESKTNHIIERFR